jgi:Lantibiotic dehydratase, N terminus
MKADEQTLRPVPASTEESTGAPPHLIPLPDSGWRLWRCSSLRGAGFPATEVLKLSTSACADATDQLLEAEDEAQLAQKRALATVRETLDALRREQEWENTGRRQPLVNALRSLAKGKIPARAQITDEIAIAVDALRAASMRRDEAQASFRQSYAEALARTSRSIHEVAGSSRLQEAIIWQNRPAFHSAIVPILRHAAESDTSGGGSKHRQHQELIATYLQRYCVKNDTIGFFGPVGWARLVEHGEALTLRPGQGLLATRNVYFESWCIDALAESLNKNRALRPWIAPHRVPLIHVIGTVLMLPRSRPVRLTPEQATILRLCDGLNTAKEIAATLMRSFPAGVKSEAEAYHLLEQLNMKGLILWKLEIPTGLFPERTLRSLLGRIEDESLRRTAFEATDEMERCRAEVMLAAGNPEKLNHALEAMDASFTRSADAPSMRSAGKMYAARTLIYEDCRRDIELEFGPELLRQLAPPLDLLLTSARWLTLRMADFYRTLFKDIYTKLARQGASSTVSAATLWSHAQALLFDRSKSAGDAVLPAFQQHWADILSLPAGQRRAHYSAEQLRPHVHKTFNAPRAGWSSARYHSPDIMIAASSVEAIRNGDYQFVLGEFHLGENTLRSALFVAQHPCPEELFRAIEMDLPEHGVRIAPPKTWPGFTARTAPTLMPSDHFRLMVTPDSFCEPGKRALPLGSLLVEETGGELFMRTFDGRSRFDIIEVFADLFSIQAVNKFRIFKACSYLPRISIDRLVISRESWGFTSEELAFAFHKEDAARFLAIRRWARAHNIPRFIFVKSPVEMKPLYVDLKSPIYVDIFAKVVRQTRASDYAKSLITISEMLPTHDQAWLVDAEGQRYTSEFRMIAVDSAK